MPDFDTCQSLDCTGPLSPFEERPILLHHGHHTRDTTRKLLHNVNFELELHISGRWYCIVGTDRLNRISCTVYNCPGTVRISA
jgi:hypothetical protein